MRCKKSSRSGRLANSLRRGVDVQAFNAQTVRGHDDDRRRAGRPHRWPGDLHLVKPRALLRRTRPAIEAPRRHTERRGDITPSVALSLPLPTVLNRLLAECARVPPSHAAAIAILPRSGLLELNDCLIHQLLLVSGTVDHSLAFD